MKHLYPMIYAAGALWLGAIPARAFGCELPPLIAIPAKDEAGAQAERLRGEAAAYFAGVQRYVDCVQTELAAAGGDAAPPLVKAVLVARNNAAVAEAKAIGKLFEANVGPLTAPNGESVLRQLIDGLSSGAPDYDLMTPELAADTRAGLADIQGSLSRMGAIRTIEPRGIDDQGHSVYNVRHERGWVTWYIGRLPDGKIAYASFLLPEGK